MGNALTVGDSVVGGIPTSAKEVSFNNENCHIIDTNNTQEAIKQLDVANYATNQNLSNLLQVKTQTLSVASIEANDDVTMQAQCATVSGYIPIGVVGTSTSYGGAIAVTRCMLASNGDIVAQVKNGYASVMSNVWINVNVLYVKNL